VQLCVEQRGEDGRGKGRGAARHGRVDERERDLDYAVAEERLGEGSRGVACCSRRGAVAGQED
jgi:hypothetical protein